VLVTLAPTRARRKPHRKSLSEIFVRMLLCVPTFHMPDEATRERHGSVQIAIRTAERPENVFPLRSLVERVSVVDRVPGFVTQIHHDLSRIFEIVHLCLQPR